MAVTPTYPGVYVEEISSGVRTITGVATSITAFMGRALRGPIDEPTLINNFGEFELIFGGQDVDYPMSYTVRDFYGNGGTKALIVRLFKDPIKKAVTEATDAVLAAVNEAAEVDGATTATVATAARTQANEFTAEPEQTAANNVAAAVETAAGEDGATLDTVKDAAEDARDTAIEETPSPKAQLVLPLDGIESAQAVLTAVNEAAGVEEPPPTPTSVAEAARAKADEFTTEPEQTVANNVATAVENAADDEEATLETVITAAENAVEEQSLVLEAENPGKWGNKLEVIVNYDGIDKEVADRYNLEKTDLFNLILSDDSGTVETLRNLSVIEGPRRLDRVLKSESQLLRVPEDQQKQPILSSIRPAETPTDNNDQPIPIEVQTANEGVDSFTPLKSGDVLGSETDKTGLYALEKADLFNLLCIPPDVRDLDTDKGVYAQALDYCLKRRAMLIVDPLAAWGANEATAAAAARDGLAGLGLTGDKARNAALYFPRVIQRDPLREDQEDTFVACGIIAGIMARTDANRGVWKAPAGIDATISGIERLQVNLSNEDNGVLNPLGINCLRNFPPVYGNVVWGARTLRGADQLADEYKYVPVRRMLLFLQESLYRGTQWVVFEPNDEPLWAQIRLNIGQFMNGLFRQGAFQGKSPNEAYFVKCDSETTTQYDIDRGIVNIIVGFAPLKPAEFVILKFQQITRQAA
ncbi:MAG: phage tail sheath subtilisin-like domain-containing protein [Crocosphaera sp.]|nr:phage tail sheath subtilisin-like domain-containing protein [Crocosphaera sp.]